MDRKAEITRRTNFPAYAKALQHLTGEKVALDELTAPSFVSDFMENRKKISTKYLPEAKSTIPFDSKSTPEFLILIKRLHELNAQPLYIFTGRTEECGFYQLSSIKDFNFSFEFDHHSCGYISLGTIDANDSMILDFEGELGKPFSHILTVQLRGFNWPKARKLLYAIK